MGAGLWIVVEGTDGTGKSTQVELLGRRLQAVITSEPGATPVGGPIRQLLLGESALEMTPRTEAMLFAADRCETVHTVIGPTLEQGRHVVSSRSVWSSIAYQSAMGVDENWLLQLNDVALGGRWPDVVVLLETDSAVALRRRETRGTSDRVEARGDGFQQQVAVRFTELAHRHGWPRVDASTSREEVDAAVWTAVANRSRQLGVVLDDHCGCAGAADSLGEGERR